MKQTKKILALLLCAAMTLALAAPVLAAGTHDVGQYKYYTVIGDSNASGYGLDAYFENAGSTESVDDSFRTPGAFPDIIAKAVGAETVNVRAHSGWRTNEFLRTMDKMTKSEAGKHTDTYMYALGFIEKSVLNGEKEKMIDAIQKADLISVNFGSNDIYSHAINQTADMYPDLKDELMALLEDTLADLGDSATMQDIKDALSAAIAKLDFLPQLIDDFRANVRMNAETYKTNIVKVIEAIRELNANAKIILLGLFCPIALDITMPDGTPLSLYTSSDKLVDEVNVYLRDECPVKDEYTYVDVSKAECFGLPALDFGKLIAFDENVKYSAVKMVHPNEAGHQYIAAQILNTLASEPIVPAVAASYSKLLQRTTLKWNRLDNASYYLIYRSCSEGGRYTLIGTSLNTTFIDLLTLKGHTYYYKVLPVAGKSASVSFGYSAPVAVAAR